MFNFSDPNLISQGNVLDKVYVKLKNSSFFIPVRENSVLNSVLVDAELVSLVPQQLPLSFPIKVVEKTMSLTSNAALAVMIMQIILQIMLKGSLKHILDIFLTIQLMVYVLLFNLRLPALGLMILQEVKKLIEFEALNITRFIQLFDPGFTIKSWLAGVKTVIVNEDQLVSIASDLIVFISLGVGCLFIIITMLIIKLVATPRISDWIHTKLVMVKRNMVWNGLINTLKLSCFKTAFPSATKCVC